MTIQTIKAQHSEPMETLSCTQSLYLDFYEFIEVDFSRLKDLIDIDELLSKTKLIIYEKNLIFIDFAH